MNRTQQMLYNAMTLGARGGHAPETNANARVYRAICENPGGSLMDIATAAHMNHSSVVQAALRLEKAGLIQTKRLPARRLCWPAPIRKAAG